MIGDGPAGGKAARAPVLFRRAAGLDPALDGLGGRALGAIQVIIHLGAQPEVLGGAEIMRETQTGIQGDGASAAHQIADAARRRV